MTSIIACHSLDSPHCCVSVVSPHSFQTAMNMASYNLRVLNSLFLVNVIGELQGEMTLLIPYAKLSVCASLWSLPFIWLLLPEGSPSSGETRGSEKEKAE